MVPDYVQMGVGVDIILGGPRRRWPRGEKLAAVSATFEPGMTVTDVARTLGISRSMLFAWRKAFRAEVGFPALPRRVAFVPVTLTHEDGVATPPLPTGLIEISFSASPQMRISGGVDAGLACALVQALTLR
jgi:transposase